MCIFLFFILTDLTNEDKMDIYSILISTSVVFFLTNAQKLCNDNVNTEDCIFECDYKCTSNGCNITRVYCGNFTQELNKTHCVHTCSPYCSSGICNQTSGKCAIGCIQGFYGDRCQYLCPHDCIGKHVISRITLVAKAIYLIT